MRALIFALFVLPLFVGCSSSSDPEPEAVEIPTTPAPLDDSPEFELFQRGKNLYESGLYLVAKDAFQSLRDSYPLGPYTEFAEIKLADSEFELRNYTEAGLLYEELMKSRPSSPAMPYLLLMAGHSFQLSNRGVGRDTEPLQKSRQHLSDLLNRFPGSMYETAAKHYKAEVETLLAEHDKQILVFYKKQEKIAAYEARLAAFEEHWGTAELADTGIIEEADDDESLETTEEDELPAEPTIVRVASTSLAPPEIVHAGRGTTDTALDSSESPSPFRASLKVAAAPLDSPESSGGTLLRQVECKNDGQLLVLHVNESDALNALDQSSVQPKDSVLSLHLGSSLNETTFSCSGMTVTSSSNGTLEVSPAGPAELFLLKHPSRLVLAFRQTGLAG